VDAALARVAFELDFQRIGKIEPLVAFRQETLDFAE